MDYDQKQEVVKLYKMLCSDGTSYNPGLEIIAEHDTTPLWVAGVMYLFFDRYLSGVSESIQTEFMHETLRLFHLMIKDQQGASFITRITEEDNYN